MIMRDRAIAAPDGADVTFGTAQHTEATPPDGARGYWWAPDGGRLLVARVDGAAVEQTRCGCPVRC